MQASVNDDQGAVVSEWRRVPSPAGDHSLRAGYSLTPSTVFIIGNLSGYHRFN